MPASTSVPPPSCAAPNASPSQSQATTVAATGSSIAMIAARVAGTKRSAAIINAKGTIVPSAIIQLMRDQTGKPHASYAASSSWPTGNDHHGWTSAQKSEAKRKPYVVREMDRAA